MHALLAGWGADRMPTLAGPGYTPLVVETAKQFSALVYQRYHIPLMELKEHYNRMDPDFDRWYSLAEGDKHTAFEAAHQQREAHLFDELEKVLAIANFSELSADDLRGVVRDHVHEESGVRVKVTAEDYPLLRVWTRGQYVARRAAGYKVLDTPMYAMVFVAVRIRLQDEPEDVYLKLVKNVPCDELDSLMPKARPAMSHIDMLKLACFGALGLAWVFWRLHYYFNYEDPRKELGLALACLALAAFKTYRSYNDRVRRYTMQLVHRLHYNSLANNRAALSHVMDMARVERMKALFTMYWAAVAAQAQAAQGQGSQGPRLGDIQRTAEEWIAREFKAHVQTDAQGLVKELIGIGLVAPGKDGTLKAVAPGEAIVLLRNATNNPMWFDMSCRV
jgi:hypothetical protein